MKQLHHDLWQQYFPEFIDANDASTNAFIASARLVNLSDHQIVFSAGDRCEHYLLLVDGLVRVQLISESGREVMLYTVSPGDSCVLTTSCLLENKPYPAEAYTEGEVRAFLIARSDFNSALENSVFFRHYVFNNFSSRLSSVIHRMEDVVLNSVEVRLAKYLLSINDSDIRITHQYLALEMGTAREVISRHLKLLENSGWVKLSRGKIKILDSMALEKLTRSG